MKFDEHIFDLTKHIFWMYCETIGTVLDFVVINLFLSKFVPFLCPEKHSHHAYASQRGNLQLFRLTLLCELEFHKIIENLSVANFCTRSSPIGLKTGGVVMFTISPTLFFLSLQVYVEIRKIVCTWVVCSPSLLAGKA